MPLEKTFGFKQNQGIQTPIYGPGIGGDPIQKARIENSNIRERTGSTAYQRAGLDPNYIPGYGHPSAANNIGGVLPRAQWDQQFQTPATQAGNAARDASATALNAIGVPTIPSGPVATQGGTMMRVDPFGPHPVNNLFPGQANTASLANHVQVTPNLPINPSATGNETGDQWAAIQRGNAAAYAPGGTFQGRADPYQPTPAGDLAAIAARYGTPGGQNGVAFVNDQRSNVDAAGNPLKQAAKTLPVIPGVTPAVDANNKANPYA